MSPTESSLSLVFLNKLLALTSSSFPLLSKPFRSWPLASTYQKIDQSATQSCFKISSYVTEKFEKYLARLWTVITTTST